MWWIWNSYFWNVSVYIIFVWWWDLGFWLEEITKHSPFGIAVLKLFNFIAFLKKCISLVYIWNL